VQTIKAYLYNLTFLFIYLITGHSHAGTISNVEVSLDRVKYESLNTEYSFNSDIWGTVSEFQSITLTSPLNNTYLLALQDEGDQWGYDVDGSEADILAEFVYGTYRFDVVYTDLTTDSAEAVLGGIFPDFPTSLSLDGNLVTWDSWLDPIGFSYIEFNIDGGTDESEISAILAPSAVLYELPSDFIQDGTQYEIELWFLSHQTDTSHLASISTMQTTVPVPAAVWLFGSGLLGLIGFSRRKKAA